MKYEDMLRVNAYPSEDRLWCKDHGYSCLEWTDEFCSEIRHRDENPDPKWAEKMEQMSQEEHAAFLKEIPYLYQKAKLEDFVPALQSKALTLKDAIILGDNRVGKTHLMYALALKQKKDHPRKTVKVEKAFYIIQKMKASGTDWLTFLERNYASLDYLYIDEVDKVIVKDSEYTYLNWLVDNRHENGRPTMMTANGTLENLTKTIGQSIVARLTNEKEGGALINLTDKARRTA